MAALVIATPGVAGSGPKGTSVETARQHFQRNVDAYLVLRREATRSIPALRVTADAREIFETVEALAEAIRAARPTAKPGDLFTPDVAKLFRHLISDTLRRNRISVADLIADLNEEVPPETPRPAVNRRFPWGRGAAMLPCLLATLPELPPALQYRLIERDLVLLDVEAHLVVDLLLDALPPVERPLSSVVLASRSDRER
jgi:hypothetical protein